MSQRNWFSSSFPLIGQWSCPPLSICKDHLPLLMVCSAHPGVGTDSSLRSSCCAPAQDALWSEMPSALSKALRFPGSSPPARRSVSRTGYQCVLPGDEQGGEWWIIPLTLAHVLTGLCKPLQFIYGQHIPYCPYGVDVHEWLKKPKILLSQCPSDMSWGPRPFKVMVPEKSNIAKK